MVPGQRHAPERFRTEMHATHSEHWERVVSGLPHDAMVVSRGTKTLVLLSDTLTNTERTWFSEHVIEIVDGTPFGLSVPLGNVASMMEATAKH